MKRKILSLLLVLVAVFCFACGGGSAQCSIADVSETRVAILAEKTDGKATVLNCMEYLAEKGEFTYEIVGGMVTSINGKANAADFSSCWMLYTSDAEMSNVAWGTVEYNGETLASAILGAETLIVEEGEFYVWVYQSF